MKNANIKWESSGYPRSLDFDDAYFSISGALGEKRYVFLEQNNLPQAWRNKTSFAIGECGFGFGLNFLLTLKAWMEDEAKCGKLTLFSCDSLPISYEDLRKFYNLCQELRPLSDKLLAYYKNLHSGINKFDFGGVVLVLLISDAANALNEFDDNIDVWYLDGFAPSKNSSIWSEEVLKIVARKSAQNASLSTYTVAGLVRRNLEKVGFSVEKTKGFGKKAEMLKGKFIGFDL